MSDTELDLTPHQVLVRPCGTEYALWVAFAKANDLTIPEMVRVVIAEAMGEPELYARVQAAQKLAKAERGARMQQHRWKERDGAAETQAAAKSVNSMISDLDEPLIAEDDIDAPLEE